MAALAKCALATRSPTGRTSPPRTGSYLFSDHTPFAHTLLKDRSGPALYFLGHQERKCRSGSAWRVTTPGRMSRDARQKGSRCNDG
jgi:hypothetical protein